MAKKRKHQPGKKARVPAPAAAVPDPAPSPAPAPAEKQPSVGQQRRAAQRKQRIARADRAAASAPEAGDPVEEPTFFFGFSVPWAKLVLARVLFFMLLAWDALEQISHAPRYGAGNFNVAHVPLLDALAPGRALYAGAQLVSAYLFVLAACGVATRVVLPIVTVIYGWLYFSSHLDSYQHHYLVWLLLVLACFVPWQRPANATPATPVRSWALRLVLLQLALLYFWAAVSKMNSAWIDGRTLDMQLSGGLERFIQATVGYNVAAVGVIIVELVLAATIWWRGGWKYAWWQGLALHITILWTGFDIGLFVWLMLGLYVLVIPDRVWVWLASTAPLRWLREAAGALAAWFEGSSRFVVWVLAAAASVVLAVVSRFDHAVAIGTALLLVLVAATASAVSRKRGHVAWLAIAHVLAFVLWTAVDRTTDTAVDYYRLWGGSSRRLGDPATAEAAYRKMTEVAPNNAQGFFQLGRLLLARDAGDEGIAALRRAQNLEPLRARAYVAEARWLSARGKREEAIAKAREATIVEPTDADARTLLNSLLGTR